MAGHGGKRAGAGRKKGAIPAKTAQALTATVQQERERAEAKTPWAVLPPLAPMTPKEVMLDNMDWARAHVDRIRREIDEAGDLTLKEKVELIKQLAEARAMCHSFAKDVAPYCHPKLSAQTPAPSGNVEPTVIEHEPYRDVFGEISQRMREASGVR